MSQIRGLCVALLMMLPCVALAQGDAFDRELSAIQTDWALANYRTAEAQRNAAFEKLAKRADAFVATNPKRAEPLIWSGIVKSTWAGVRGGLGALGLVKQARQALEAAERLDAKALDGSVYTSLGALYGSVPGWPVSFGDDDKARDYLKRAVELNPNGIDPNYFYGSFLADQDEVALARTHLKRALAAPPRPGREIADAGRRGEIERLLAELPER